METAPSSSPAPSPTPAALSVQDERILAALAHISVLLPMFGLIAAIVIWVTQKERSRFVAFQALQAVAFQLLLIIAWFAGMACYMGTFFLTFFGAFAVSSSQRALGPASLLFFLPFVVMGILILLMLGFVIYGVVAAVLTFQGHDFHYALVGRWVERYQQKTTPV